MESVVRVGIGLCLLVSACGGSSKPPPGGDGGASTSGAGGSGANGAQGGVATGGAAVVGGMNPVGGTAPAEGGAGCESCGGEPPVDPVCEPHTQVCEDNRVIACTFDGTGTTVASDCGAHYHCVEVGNSAHCDPNDCVPGKPVCDGNVVKTCTKAGMLPAKGEDCGDEACEDGECVPRICEPGARYCKELSIYECDANGTHESLWLECDGRFTCRERDGTADCAARACEPGKAGCVGEASGTCATDGLSLTSTGTDCTAASKICDLAAGCTSEAIDTLGKKKDVESFGPGELAANVIDVHSARTLIEIEANWLLEQPRDLRFVIYEWKDGQYEVRYDEITSNNSGSGFFSSGPLEFALEAGKRYAIGAGVVVGEGYAYCDTGGWTGIASFVGALGGARAFHEDSFSVGVGSSLYVLRLTTTPP